MSGSEHWQKPSPPKTAVSERPGRPARDYDMRNPRTTARLIGMSKTPALPQRSRPADGVGVRAAGPADLEVVFALASAFYSAEGFTTRVDELRSNLKSLLSSQTARTAVVTRGRELVAFAITTTSFGLESGLIAELEDLYVAPAARRRGIAGQLIDDSARWARRRGCRYLELVVAPNGRDVTHLDRYYRNRGFQDSGRRLTARDL